MLAAAGAHVAVCKLLLKRGANASLKTRADAFGAPSWTALDFALNSKNQEIIAALQSKPAPDAPPAPTPLVSLSSATLTNSNSSDTDSAADYKAALSSSS